MNNHIMVLAPANHRKRSYCVSTLSSAILKMVHAGQIFKVWWALVGVTVPQQARFHAAGVS